MENRVTLGEHQRKIKQEDIICLEHAKGRVLGQRWSLKTRLSGGSFGQVYVAERMKNKKLYIVKQESKDTMRKHLWNEYEILKYLQRGCDRIPRVHFWEMIDGFQYVVMDLEGPNLIELFNVCGNFFSSHTLSHILLKVLPTFKYIHSHGIIHRDLKPENIVIGKWPSQCREVFLIDFGLAKQYVVKTSDGKKEHAMKRNPNKNPRKTLTGTVRYSSVGSHYGDIGRGCDLESMGYVIMYFMLNAWVPWSGVKGREKGAKYKKILKIKEGVDIDDILESKPREFRIFLNAVRNLEYEQRPNYEGYIALFEEYHRRKKWNVKTKLEWETQELLSQEWPKLDDSRWNPGFRD